MFPVSDKAKTVVDALIGRVRQQGVDIRTNSPVARVLYENGKTAGIVLKSGERIASRCVVIATGGKSVPHTGSTGDGYPWAEDAGHTITDLYPTEVPITSNEPFIRSKALQGLSLRDIELTVWSDKGKKLVTHEGDMIFTHFGISGPAVLRCSQFVVKALRQAKTQAKQNTSGGSPSTKTVNTVLLTVDLFPGRSPDTIAEETLRLAKQEPKKQVKNVLRGYVSERLLPILFDMSKLPEELTFDNIPKLPWVELAKLMKQLPIRVNGTLSIEEAFVTGGGINLKEIDPKTMESKLVSGLFFCGEILDVHGYTGGYNITAAFTTGYSAGKSSAERSAEQLLQ
jgi:predicted Rossmann fold flavoprotein